MRSCNNKTERKQLQKNKKQYVMPERFPLGIILTDISKKQWKIGIPIGKGGFGEIYTACRAESVKNMEDYRSVVKIEPHGNGPLFVEMHFYMRNAKEEDIKSFKTKRNLKSLGMPYLIGSGSHDLNGQKYRFLVMPRYGKDLWYYFLENGRKFPEHTVYRIGLQMLDVYEYIHNCAYVHADLKASNILLGFGKDDLNQAYLVDYGLASHYTTKDFKPDVKKMHNGTIEYTSRDAHLGVPTMRGDLEILGYNIIHWSGKSLPWDTKKMLSKPEQVQKAKELFMQNTKKNLHEIYNTDIPEPIRNYFQYISNLVYNSKPDYDKCRNYFKNGLKYLNKQNSGKLDLICLSYKKPEDKVGVLNATNSHGNAIENQNNSESIGEASINLSVQKNPTTKDLLSKKRHHISALKKNDTITSEERRMLENNNSSPSIKQKGKTIINHNITPNLNTNKTYEFNFELDVSLDANVIINIKRKKKN